EERATGQPERLEQPGIHVTAVTVYLDADLFDQRLRLIAVRVVGGDAERAADTDEHPAVVVEFVALGMTADIVVVVENQNPLVTAERVLEEERRRHSRDAAADDHEVVE